MTVRKQTKTINAAAAEATIKREFTNEERAALKEDLEQQLNSDIESLWQRMGFTEYSVQTSILKFVARVTLYAVGFVASLYAVSFLSAILVAAGWPLFIVAVLEIVALVLTMIGSWMLSDAVVNYVAAGNVTRDIKRGFSWLKGKAAGSTTFLKERMATVH